jgi:Tfp pilus assembly protein PilO
MSKISKAQKEQLIGIGAGTVALMGILWYFGVTAKQEELSKTEKNTAQIRDTLRKEEGTMRLGEEIAEKLEARTQLLEKRESLLAPDRDAYAWIISTINPFIQTRKGVNIYHYSQPEVTELGIIPDFPYKWATFHLEGTGYYHEFGKFFADLENSYPCFRVQNLDINASTANGIEAEKLNVVFDLVVPVKPSDTK